MATCQAGAACCDSRIVSGERQPVDGIDGVLCAQCLSALRQSVRNLVSDYSALGALVGERPVTGDISVSMTPDPVVPINVHVMALQDELAANAEAALLAVRDKLSAPVPVRQRGRGYPVRNGPVILMAHKVFRPDVGLLVNAGADIAVRIMRAHRKVNSVVGERKQRRRLAMPCPMDECGMPTLGIDNGETDVTCRSCGGRWTEAEYEWFAGMITGSTDQKEVHMLRWLLAEKTWQVAQLEQFCDNTDDMLAKVKAIAGNDLSQFDTATVQAYLVETLGDWAPGQWM
jgi:hypothetical protein